MDHVQVGDFLGLASALKDDPTRALVDDVAYFLGSIGRNLVTEADAHLGLANRLLQKQSPAKAKAGTAVPTGKAATLIKAGERAWKRARRAFLKGKVAKAPSTSGARAKGSGG